MENATTTNSSNITNYIYGNTTIFSNETNNATVEPDESSGTTPVMPATSEPTKKPTEKRATDIIDILIGDRRRRAKRAKRVSYPYCLCLNNSHHYNSHFSVVSAEKLKVL